MGAPPSANAGVDPRQEDKYLLQVTAGPSYEDAELYNVQVNGSDSCRIENDLMTIFLRVRIRDYHGLPPNSPTSHPYFAHPLHQHDRYSINFTFIPKVAIAGEDVVMGFDFDHPVRDRLPPGFKTAMKIVTTCLDPGIYADPYSDLPYLYGAALSSFFAFRVGRKTAGDAAGEAAGDDDDDDDDDDEAAGVVEEGGDGDGLEIRERLQIPRKAEKRRKFFLKEEKLKAFTFEKHRVYQADFFNPYLDFSNFALKIPGISISVAKYIDEKTHCVRYVLKNRRSGEVFFVVVFKLLFGQELQETLNKSQGRGDAKDETSENRDGANSNIQSIPSEISRSAESKERDLKDPQSGKTFHRDQDAPASVEHTTRHSQLSSVSNNLRSIGGSASSAAQNLANSIASSFSFLGFGAGVPQEQSKRNDMSDEGRESNSNISNEDVDKISDSTVEEFLKSRQ